MEVLHVRDCPNLSPMLERLREATELPVTTREITTAADAGTAGMNGSPTVLINGRDPFPTPEGCECGMSCRLYRDEHGQTVPAPSVTQLRNALATYTHSGDESCCNSARHGAAPGAWLTQAMPVDPAEKTVHQAILRAFAATGRPPTLSDLDAVTTGSGRATADVLAELHDLDAIRLAPDGQIAVAYPFSANPTRHRVRIGDRTDVYAMCAIDALGISAMLGEETRIASVDVTTGHPISITMSAGSTKWDPPGAVVFVGADGSGGPLADCCCDYLNFFTETGAAHAWATAHPHVPGQILTPAEAEERGARLFGPLLVNG
ncbi:alkylmercury lyase family protein [Pseudonocardia sichuanensis]